MVSPKKDNYKALKEICEQHHVERLDLHNSSVTGEDAPDRQSELNLLVELLPISENESFMYCPLWSKLSRNFSAGRSIC